MVETHTRILGIAPYDGMRTAMEQAAQAYPNVELEVYTGDLEEGQAIVQSMTPNSYDCIISRGGTATLTTVEGEKLMIKDAGGGRWEITDAKGGKATITQADVGQSNGMVHVIDTVLMPK